MSEYFEAYKKWKEEYIRLNKRLLKKYLTLFEEKNIIRLMLSYNKATNNLTFWEVTERKL